MSAWIIRGKKRINLGLNELAGVIRNRVTHARSQIRRGIGMTGSIKTISVVGLGKLGSPLAAIMAAKGFDTIGVDVNEAFIDSVNEGRAPVQEPLLQEFIDQGRERLSATTDLSEAVLASQVTFIVVPTPSDAKGVFTNRYVLEAIEQIGQALRGKKDRHVVIVSSTVMPGSCDGPIKQTLELTSGRTVGLDVGLCYNPEFIALGSVVNDMLRPDFILLGESDEPSGDVVAEIYSKSCENNPPVRRMNLVNAELTKISVNTFVTTKISYANMLADVCDRIPGADVDVVTAAVGSDSRIGTKYLRGALGFGGPCFPRDNIAFIRMGEQVGAHTELVEATDSINRYQVDRLAQAVQSRVPEGSTVAILGLSYKPDTAVIEASQAVQLAQRLSQRGYKVQVYDPLARDNAVAVLRDAVTPADTAEDCVRDASFVMRTVSTCTGHTRQQFDTQYCHPDLCGSISAIQRTVPVAAKSARSAPWARDRITLSTNSRSPNPQFSSLITCNALPRAQRRSQSLSSSELR